MIVTTTLIYLLRKRIKKLYLKVEDYLDKHGEKVIGIIFITAGTAYFFSMILILGGFR